MDSFWGGRRPTFRGGLGGGGWGSPPVAFPAVVSVVSVSAVCDQVDQGDQVVPAHQVDGIDEVHQLDPVHQVDHKDEYTENIHQIKKMLKLMV